MDVISEQFKQEFRNQEIQANRHSLMGFGWILLAEAVVWFLTMIDFFIIDKASVSIALVITCILFSPLIYIAKKGDLSRPSLKYFFLMLISITTSTFLAFLTYHATLVVVIPLIFSLQYHDRHALWFTFGFNTLTMFIGSYIGFYFGICDMNVLLKDASTYQHLMSCLSEDYTLVFSVEEDPSFILIVYEFLPRTMILFVFTILLRYTVINNRESAARIAELTYHNDRDARTHLFSKSKYEAMLEHYYPGIPQIAVAFWDLNNLKKINDKYGHSMGDVLIETFSQKLREYSTDRCNIFRVGGDEFVMILENPEENELSAIIRNIRDSLDNIHEQKCFRVSCAVGQASGSGKDIHEIVNLADEKMYEDKKRCKEGLLQNK